MILLYCFQIKKKYSEIASHAVFHGTFDLSLNWLVHSLKQGQRQIRIFQINFDFIESKIQVFKTKIIKKGKFRNF